MILISAMSSNRVIGAGDGMPWDVPDEYQQYLDFTRGQTILLGRRSFEIFGPDLSADHAVVLTRSGSVERPNGYEGDIATASGIEEAIARGRSFGKTLFCGGGAKVYEQALPHAEAMYLSIIKGNFEGNAYFPEFDPGDWRVVAERDEPQFHFLQYERAKREPSP